MSRRTEHLEQPAFLARVDHLVDTDLSLNNLKVELLLNLVFQVDNCLSGHSVQDASVRVRCNELHPPKPRLLKNENVQDCTFFYVVIK